MHAPPPRPGPRTKPRSFVGPTLLSLLLLSPAACQRDPLDVENPNELQALLDDGQLDLSSSALTAPAGGGVGTSPVAPPAQDAGPAPGGGAGGVSGTGGRSTGGRAGAGGGSSEGTGGTGGVVDGGVPPSRDGSARPDVRSDGSPPIDGGEFDGGSFPVFCPGDSFPRPPGSVCPLQATGMWNLDSCNEVRSELQDDSFNGFTAFRSVKTACVPGVEGLGVALPNPNDLVYVPDQPAFTFDAGVTVAGWFKPTDVTGVRTLFRKRDGITSALALMIVQKHFVFVVGRDRGLPAAVIAPAKAGVFTHVAATYDGEMLRLYLNGEEAAATRAPGRVEAGEGPLLFGNDGLKRRFDGTIDKLWFATGAASPETIEGLQCLRKPPTFVSRPGVSAPVPAGTGVNFDLLLTNNSGPTCQSQSFQIFNDSFQPGFTIQPSFQFTTLAPGQTATLPVVITSNEDGEPGTTSFTVSALDHFDR
ncbi:MAG TPA: LamG domain-containing protein, partial [Polyangia bacterium]